jgi:hypothetical protein
MDLDIGGMADFLMANRAVSGLFTEAAADLQNIVEYHIYCETYNERPLNNEEENSLSNVLQTASYLGLDTVVYAMICYKLAPLVAAMDGGVTAVLVMGAGYQLYRTSLVEKITNGFGVIGRYVIRTAEEGRRNISTLFQSNEETLSFNKIAKATSSIPITMAASIPEIIGKGPEFVVNELMKSPEFRASSSKLLARIVLSQTEYPSIGRNAKHSLAGKAANSYFAQTHSDADINWMIEYHNFIEQQVEDALEHEKTLSNWIKVNILPIKN